MYTTNRKLFLIDKKIKMGIRQLAEIAGTIYGTNDTIFFRSSIDYENSNKLSEILKSANFQDVETAYAAAFMCRSSLPEDGVKTAVVFLNEFICYCDKFALPEDLVSKNIDNINQYLNQYLERIVRENQGKLPGGGLAYLTLQRPVIKYCRDHNIEILGNIYAKILAKPLALLADNSGLEFNEVYERVKALAPNQFYSLNQVGIERSINIQSRYTDVITMGLDISDGKIKNLMDSGIYDDLNSTKAALALLTQWVKDLLTIKQTV